MIASMSLEEKFKTLIQNYQSISVSNEDLENQNKHLRWNLVDVLKQTKKVVASTSSSVYDDEGKVSNDSLILQERRNLTKGQEEDEGL